LDFRNLAFEPVRKKTEARFGVLDSEKLKLDDLLTLAESFENDEDDAAVVTAVKGIYEHPLLAEVLEMDMFRPLKERLDALTSPEARALLVFLRKLPCAEASMVEWNDVLTYCVASNTAPYLLGASQSALAAMYYLVAYLKKESGNLSVSLNVLIDARNHINKYGSQGANAGTSEHFARHLLTRAVNKCDSEMSGTQSASVVLGEKSFLCSEATIFIDNHCVLDEAQREIALAASVAFAAAPAAEGDAPSEAGAPAAPPEVAAEGGDDDDDDDDDVDVDVNRKDEVRRNFEGCNRNEAQNQTRENDMALDSADEADDGPPEPSSRIYSIEVAAVKGPPLVPGYVRKVAVRCSENYKYRGDHLEALNYIQYMSMISVLPRKSASSRTQQSSEDGEGADDGGGGQGRKASKTFAFDCMHPLHKSHVQVIKEKFSCLVRAGGARPAFPKPLPLGEKPSSAWQAQRDRAAAFNVANFVPWSVQALPELSIERLRTWVQKQHGIQFNRTLPFEARLQATNNLLEFKNYAYLTSLKQKDADMSRQYRQRNRKKWSEDEVDEFLQAYDGANGKKSSENSIAKLLAQQASRKTNTDRAQKAQVTNVWVSELIADLAQAVSSAPVVSCLDSGATLSLSTLERLRQDVKHEHRSPSESSVRSVTHLLNGERQDDSNSESDSENCMDADSAAQCRYSQSDAQHFSQERDAMPYVRDEVDACSWPKSFEQLSQEMFDSERSVWEQHCEKAHARGEESDSLKPPLNPGQRLVARTILKKVRLVSNKNSAASMHDDGDWSQDDDSLVGTMVVGGAGVGKSYLLSSLLDVIEHEKLGTSVCTSYTGIATLQMPSPRATICWLFGIPGKIVNSRTDLPPMTPKQIMRFESIAGDPSKLVLLALDEISFLDAAVFHHVNCRLRQLRNNGAPFGGVHVVALGDFHQKPCVAGTQLSKAALLADLPEELVANLKLNVESNKNKRMRLSELGADRKGAELFKRLRRLDLVQQMRASEDPEHSANLECMRDVSSVQPVSEAFLENLRALSPEAIAKAGPKLKYATIGAMSHREIDQLNALQCTEFARENHVPIIKWRKTLVGDAAGFINDEETERLFVEEDAGLHEFFVEGAPATITRNINPAIGLVNGTDCVMASLTPAPDTPSIEECIELAAEESANWTSGGVLIVLLKHRPLSINVKPKLSAAHLLAVRNSGFGLCTADAADSDSAAAASREVVQTAEVIIPIAILSDSSMLSRQKYAPTSTWAALDLPISFQTIMFDLVMNFACSDFKLQGRTVEFLIASIGARKHFPPITLSALYVLASRVRLSQNFLTLGLDKSNMDHLRKLRHSPALVIWEKAYDPSGVWRQELAIASGRAVLQRQIDEHYQPRRAKFQPGRAPYACGPVLATATKEMGIETTSAVNANLSAQRAGDGTSNHSEPPDTDKKASSLQKLPAIRLVARGLQNVGNTCYVNASLQALAASPSFVEHVHMLLSTAVSNYFFFAKNPSLKFLKELCAVLASLNGATAEDVIPMGNFVLQLPAKFSNRTTEHDAEELMSWIRDQIDTFQKQLCKTMPLDRNRLELPFQGIMEIVSWCIPCGNFHETRSEAFETLSLALIQSHAGAPLQLEDLFHDLFRDDWVEAKCAVCSPEGDKTTARRTSITTAPKSLFLQLKRFTISDTGSPSKSCAPVICPRKLVLSLPLGKKATYDHRATVSHVGPNQHDGHYVTFRRSPEGCTFTMNDAKTSEIYDETIFDSRALSGGGPTNETPYILIYEREPGEEEKEEEEHEERGRNERTELSESRDDSIDKLYQSLISPVSALDRLRVLRAWEVPELSERVAMSFPAGAAGSMVDLLEKHVWRMRCGCLFDENITLYMWLLQQLNNQLCIDDPSRLNCHIFSSFFCEKVNQPLILKQTTTCPDKTSCFYLASCSNKTAATPTRPSSDGQNR
jgi:ubiquitin C-terminal hydrolase